MPFGKEALTMIGDASRGRESIAMSHRGRILVIEESPRTETGRLWEEFRSKGWNVRAVPLSRTLDEAEAARPDVVVLDLAGTRSDAERTRYLDTAARMSLLRGVNRVPVVAVEAGDRGRARPIGVTEVIRAPWSVDHVTHRIDSLSRLSALRAEICRRVDTAGRFGAPPPETETDAGAHDSHVLVVGAGIRYFTIERVLSKKATLIGAFTLETALDYLDRQAFDAIILNLPLDEAIEFTDVLRRNPDHYTVPVLALTGDGDPRLIEEIYDAGADDVILAGEGEVVFADRVEAAIAEHRLHRQLRAAHSGTHHALINDSLTGLYVRGFLMDHLETVVADARDAGAPVSVIGVVIADLADLNAEWGWAGGDQLIRQVGRLIGRLVRGTDLPARAGGDRFAVVMPGSDAADAEAAARRICGIVETTAFAVVGATGPVYATLDVGVAEIEPKDTAEALLARAFAAASPP
jgi:two-component system cell cycle response regulator